MSFVWPWLLLLLPLPLWWSRRPLDQAAQNAIHAPFAEQWLAAGQSQSQLQQHTGFHLDRSSLLLWGAWILLCLALARPVVVGQAVTTPSSGRELLMAIDVSGSMQQMDMEIDQRRMTRLDVLKTLASDFLTRRQGDRVGLVVFGSWAALYAPVSADLKTINQMLLETRIGIAGQKTALGDAIGLSVKKLLDTDIPEKVLILMTDGSNTSGALTPNQAANLASQAGIRVHTIGIGSDEMITQGFFGLQRQNPSVDLDESTLKAIAAKTGGQYFRAKKAEDLEQIYDQIDQLETVEREDLIRRKQTEYFWAPGLLALSLFCLAWILKRRGLL